MFLHLNSPGDWSIKVGFNFSREITNHALLRAYFLFQSNLFNLYLFSKMLQSHLPLLTSSNHLFVVVLLVTFLLMLYLKNKNHRGIGLTGAESFHILSRLRIK